MLFNKLSQAVEPFYHNLEIATNAKPWPKILDGTPRRASCNSFGFGGTNAHIILESYIPSVAKKDTAPTLTQLTPFIFSAASERSLKGVLADYSEHLRVNPTINLFDLAYTLYARRTAHSMKVTISATCKFSFLGVKLPR